MSKTIVEDMEQLLSLRPNWDGYGAPAIDPDVVAAARTFSNALLRSITCMPVVVPMSRGNLQFEWYRSSKVLELEFETPSTIHSLQWYPEVGIEKEEIFNVSDIEHAAELIKWFMCKDG